MKRNIIFMNGPPGSGKDESANYLVNNHGYKHTTFKEAAFDLVCGYYNISMEEYLKLYNDRATKEVPSDLLDGKSPRKAMQYVVEEIYKPKHGKDVLANKVIDIIKNDPYNNYVVSDLGLPEEEIIIHYRLRTERYAIIQLQKPECNYNNDTRNKTLIYHYVIQNNKDKQSLYNRLDNIVAIVKNLP